MRINNSRRITLDNDKLRFCFVFSDHGTYLTGHDPLNSRCLCIPDFIKVKKENNDLIFDVVETNSYSIGNMKRFFVKLDRFLKTANTRFKQVLLLKGLGYRANLIDNNTKIECKIGYSHLKSLQIPDSINVKIGNKKTLVQVEGLEKAELGNFVSKLINLRNRDNYKAKGFSKKHEQKELKPIRKK